MGHDTAGRELAAGDRAQDDDQFRLAVDAAGMGTWDWHIPSGQVIWTPRTYRLFGVQPGNFAVSWDSVIGRVHASDRPMVTETIARAVRDCSRAVLEFRVERPDGAVRWLRSVGRTIVKENGRSIRRAGLIADITEEKRATPAVAPSMRPMRSPDGSFSIRQVARLSGIGTTSIKRLADSGAIGSLHSTRKDSRRFAPEQVVEFLGRTAQGIKDFNSAVAKQDLNGCLVYLIKQVLDGGNLDILLDDLVGPAMRHASRAFAADLLSRIPFVGPEPARRAFPALLARVGAVEGWDAELIECLLRAEGYVVLTAAENTDPAQFAEIAERIRACFVALVIGRSTAQARSSGLSAAAEIAARRRGVPVCIRCDERLQLPTGVKRVRSVREVGSFLRTLQRVS